MRKFWKTAVFLAIILAMFFLAVGVSYAATTGWKYACKSVSGQRVCLKAKYEYIGISIQVKGKGTYKYTPTPGWEIDTAYGPVARPSGWTTGYAEVLATYKFYYNNVWKGTAHCVQVYRNVGGRLIGARECW